MEKPIDLGASGGRDEVSSESGDDGMVKVTAAQLHKMKMANKAAWWYSFTVYEGKGVQGMVRCNHCDKSFSGRNVARSAKTHFKNAAATDCVGQTGSRKRSSSQAGLEGQPASSKGKVRAAPIFGKLGQPTIPMLAASQEQSAAAVEDLGLFFFTNPQLSFRLIDNSYLRSAFGRLGVKIPGRTALATTMLDSQYVAVMEEVQREWDVVQEGGSDNVGSNSTAVTSKGAGASSSSAAGGGKAVGGSLVFKKPFAVATDTWKKKACENGVPLMNIIGSGFMIIGRHVTSAATERNWITWGRAYARNRSQLGVDRANKLLFIAENKGKGRAFMEEEEVVLRCLG